MTFAPTANERTVLTMDDYDVCYECRGYGDDYRYDPETDEWVSNCPDCPFNDWRC